MSFFNKKRKVQLSEFCQEFYDTNFLEAKIAGMDMSNTYNELILKNLKEVDINSININQTTFNEEILCLRFELFSLAWYHQFGEKLAIANSIFTKDFLLEKGKEELWELAEPYNQAIAASATHGCSSSTSSGRARLMIVNKGRVDFFNRYYNDNHYCPTKICNNIAVPFTW